MALTKEQFSELRKKGLSTDQIIRFDKGEKPIQEGTMLHDLGKEIVNNVRGISSLPADFLNQLAFDVPRQVFEKEYGEGSWEKTYGGTAFDFTRKVGGVAGAIYGGQKLNTAIGGIASANRMFNTTLGGVKVATGGKIPNILTSKTAQGAATGAVEGAIRQKDAEYTPENIASGAGFGAALGGTLVPLGQGLGRAIQKTFSGVPRNFTDVFEKISDRVTGGRGVKIDGKLTPEQKIRSIKSQGKRFGKEQDLADREETVKIIEQREAVSKDVAERREYLRQKALSLGKNRSEKTALYRDGLRKLREEGRQELDSIKQKFDVELDSAIAGTTKDIQESLPSLFRNGSSSFAARMETIDSSRQLYQSDIKSFFQDVLNDSAVRGGATFEKIAEKARKYGMEIGGLQDDAIRVSSVPSVNMKVSIKQLQDDVADIWKSTSASVKGGEKFTASDVPYAVMQDKLASFVPELQDLRGSYKPVLLAMKQAARVFKPGLGDAGTKQAENFLRRGANGKWGSQDRWLIDMISKPTEFTDGLGGVTQKVSFIGKSKADNINSLEKIIRGRQSALRQKYEAQIARTSGDKLKVSQSLVDLGTELRVAQEQARIAKRALEMGDIKSSSEWANRLSSLAKREEKLQKIRNAQQKAAAIKRGIGYTAGAGVALGGAVAGTRYAVGRGAGAGESFQSVLQD